MGRGRKTIGKIPLNLSILSHSDICLNVLSVIKTILRDIKTNAPAHILHVHDMKSKVFEIGRVYSVC